MLLTPEEHSYVTASKSEGKMNKKIDDFIKCKELEEVENELKQFNIFDCLGLNIVEIRHSYFLKWLLDPYENHNFEDKFLKIFLKNVLLVSEEEIKNVTGYAIPSTKDIDIWNMNYAQVYREKDYIDILIVDNKNKFVCVIENKISIGQHDNQLSIYREHIDKQYNEEYKKLFLYLKPQKEEVENPYIYISYKLIRDSIKKLLNEIPNINSETFMVIEHYKKLLERDIMENKELEKKCAKIYKQHHDAIDYINRHCSPQKVICDTLENILRQNKYINIKTIQREANSGLLCLPNDIKENYINNLKISDWKSNDNCCVCIYFSLFKWKPEQIYAEILFAPIQSDLTKNIRDEIINKLKENNVIIEPEKEGWIDSKTQVKIIEYDEYFKYDEEKLYEKISESMESIKNDLIIPLKNSINEVMSNKTL